MTILTAERPSIYIAQGEHAVGSNPSHMISTILGSCVAVCLTDLRRGLGGMNHILLPEVRGSELSARGVGASAMEQLINALMKAGSRKSDLTAKVFGGAAVVAGLSDIGARNAQFVAGYLEVEGIACLASSVGGTQARRIQFRPATGQVRQRMISTVPVEEPVRVPLSSHDMELL